MFSPESRLRPDLTHTEEWLRDESLTLIEERLLTQTYPGYPETNQRLHVAELPDTFEIPEGPWWVKPEEFGQAQGKALHPWFEQMITNPNIGVVAGKGYYHNWGANYTADPIIIRRDLDEPHVLLIERGDKTGWALPGGFLNPGEEPRAAAIREAKEESGLDLSRLTHSSRVTYQGPVADLRATAHAWPETTAICFELNLESDNSKKALAEMMASNHRQWLLRTVGRFAFKNQISRLPWKGSDDADTAAWIPVSQIDERLFGSHKLLIEQALWI